MAGDDKPKSGLKRLEVASIGEDGITTQAPGGTLATQITGSLGTLEVTMRHVFEATVSVSGNIKKIHIAGDLHGGGGAGSGSIIAQGLIKKVAIDGAVVGGVAADSGNLRALAFGKVTIGTASAILPNLAALPSGIIGGDGPRSGVIAAGSIGKLKLFGDLTGALGSSSGQIVTEGATGKIFIDGDIRGGEGFSSGLVRALKLKSATVTGSIVGFEESVVDFAAMAAQPQAGIVTGTSGIDVDGSIRKVSVGRSIEGGDGARAGIVEGDKIGRVTVGESVIGGEGESSGSIRADSGLGKVKIGANLATGVGTGSGQVAVETGTLKSVTITGSIETKGASTVVLQATTIGKIRVDGSINGSESNRITIAAAGPEDGGTGIKKLTVLNDVFFTDILAGYAGTEPVNGSASIGKVTITGSLTASNIVAGVRDFLSDGFGNSDDVLIFPDLSSKVAKIAKITVGGAVAGTGSSAADHFGFTAEQVKKATIGGVRVALAKGPSNDTEVAVPRATTGDITIDEASKIPSQ